MPLPSEADIQGAIGKRIFLDRNLLIYASNQTDDYAENEQEFLDAVPSDCNPGAQANVAGMRGAIASAFGFLRPGLAPLWTTYGRVRGFPETAPEAVLSRLWDYMAANAKTVKYRNFSHGTWAAGGGNVGTGAISRLTVDSYNHVIENGIAEAKTLRCIADEHSGTARHEEVFELRGAPRGKDVLEITGSGLVMTVKCLSTSEPTQRYLQNPSFESVSLTGSTLDEITGWTPSAIANFETVTSDYYKDVPSASESRSIRFLTNGTLTQTFSDRLINWNPTVPLFAQVAFKRENACDGTLKITIGSKTASVVLDAQSGWTVLTFLVTTNAWFRNWNTTNATIVITLESNTTGELLVDDVIVGPYTPIGGSWIALVGGATPFLRDDTYSVTDTSADTGILQTWLARAYGFYLPHTSGAPTWADPT